MHNGIRSIGHSTFRKAQRLRAPCFELRTLCKSGWENVKPRVMHHIRCILHGYSSQSFFKVQTHPYKPHETFLVLVYLLTRAARWPYTSELWRVAVDETDVTLASRYTCWLARGYGLVTRRRTRGWTSLIHLAGHTTGLCVMKHTWNRSA